MDQYIVDFICSVLWLVIELDGYTHLLDEQAEKDETRENRLRGLGLHILRFWDDEIFQEIDDVLMAIEHAVLKQKKRLGL